MVLKRRKVKRSKAVRLNIAKNKEKPEEEARAPHSFVIHRGIVSKQLLHLTKDFRRVMEPFTASSLKVRKKNSVRDFVSVAGLLHVTHLCAFTSTDRSQYLRVCRLPRGPTLTFRIHNYSLAGEVLSLQRKQLVFRKQFQHAPLVVLNGLSGEGQHLKLMASMFQNLFPTINLTKVNLSMIRRCLLLNYNPETRMIDLRHYAIKVVPTGVSKSVKKLLHNKVPNLGKFKDMTEFMTKSGMLSDSEGEDDPNSHVTVPQKLATRGNQVAEKSAIRLIELGPRMTLQLMKVEDGLMDGEVLFHDIFSKTEEEKEAIRKRRAAKKRLKETRKREQEMNKKLKEKAKEEHKEKSMEGIERKRQQMLEQQKQRQPIKEKQTKRLETDILMQKAAVESHAVGDVSDDDDAEWYRKEVGEEPDQELFDNNSQKRRFGGSGGRPWKRPKLDKQHTERFKKKMPGFKTKGSNNKQGEAGSFRRGGEGSFRRGGQGSFKRGGQGSFKRGGEGSFKRGGSYRKGGDSSGRGNRSSRGGSRGSGKRRGGRN